MATRERKTTLARGQLTPNSSVSGKTGYKRVYAKYGSYYYVDKSNKWHRLCRVEHGEAAMLRALGKVKRDEDFPAETMLGLIGAFRVERLPKYAESTQVDYLCMLVRIQTMFKTRMVADISPHEVMDLRDQWKLKPRTANKYQTLLSTLMTFAIEKRLITVNPCRDVPKFKTRKRKHYMADRSFAAIRNATEAYLPTKATGRPPTQILSDTQIEAIKADARPCNVIAAEVAVNRSTVYRIKKGTYRTGVSAPKRCPNGAMYACLYDFAYLTALRAKDCRELKWSDITSQHIYVQPSKTRESTGAMLEIELTPAVRAVLDRVRALGGAEGSTYVFRTRKGKQISASALKSAWRRARKRAGINTDDRFRDLRPKALSDAKRLGMSLESLRDAAGHASVITTEDYLRGFEVKRVSLGSTAVLGVNGAERPK